MLSPLEGGAFGLVCWQGEVFLSFINKFILPTSPFNSPADGGYWAPRNIAKRKYFLLHSNSLSDMLSPFGGC